MSCKNIFTVFSKGLFLYGPIKYYNVLLLHTEAKAQVTQKKTSKIRRNIYRIWGTCCISDPYGSPKRPRGSNF